MEVKIQKKLVLWEKAGLLTPDASRKILEFESGRGSSSLIYAVGGIGALTVATGMLSIIAANWASIPGHVKLALDLMLAASLAIGIAKAELRGAAWARETQIIVLYGFVLASIGLIAQVYQLNGRPYQALLAWTILTAPLAWQGRGLFMACLWVAGLYATAGTVGAELLRIFYRDWQLGIAAGLVYAAILATIALGASQRLARVRPQLTRTLGWLGWTSWASLVSAMQFLWYTPSERKTEVLITLAISTLATGLFAGTAPRLFGDRSEPARRVRAIQLTVALSFLLSALPVLIGQFHGSKIASALGFFAVWALIGWTAFEHRAFRILNLATAIIGLRVIAIYFEVFGTLLGTGVGLMVGGALTLGLTWLWIRKRHSFRELA